jgi:hypothetical protein
MTQPNPETRRCQATRKDGEPCQAWASRSTGYCPLHSENSRQIQALGGLSKTRANMLASRLPSRLQPLLDLLSESIEQTHKGELKPAQGQAIAALASALVKVTEVSEFETRLLIIEKRMRRED